MSAKDKLSLSKLLPNYLDKLREFEGLRLKAYIPKGEPNVGVYTIGYGHRTKSVSAGDTITREEADELMYQDLYEVIERIKYSVSMRIYNRLNAGQLTALVDFVYNVGIGNFNRSSLKKKILRNLNDPTIPYEFERWVYAGGRKLQGLVTRRAYEADCWCEWLV